MCRVLQAAREHERCDGLAGRQRSRHRMPAAARANSTRHRLHRGSELLRLRQHPQGAGLRHGRVRTPCLPAYLPACLPASACPLFCVSSNEPYCMRHFCYTLTYSYTNERDPRWRVCVWSTGGSRLVHSTGEVPSRLPGRSGARHIHPLHPQRRRPPQCNDVSACRCQCVHGLLRLHVFYSDIAGLLP